MKKNLRNYLVLGLTMAALATGGGAVFAAAAESTSGTATAKAESGMIEKGSRMKGGFFAADFSQLVTDGVISQSSADKISAYMEEEQAARKAQMEAGAEAGMEAKMEAKMEAFKDMTDEERKAQRESAKETRTDMYEKMVSAGIITQSEADAIKAAMPERETIKRDFFNLDSLVTDGVIDQNTLDDMKAYTSSKMEAFKTEMGEGRPGMGGVMKNFKPGTDMDMSGQLPDIGEPKMAMTDMFEEMVSEGIITQEQADAIKAAMPTHHENTAQR